ncbi:MAG TPA: response regulator [Acidobacteriota bacterium]|nr:response regulator [Acidobacteriota bacterium]
MNDGHRLSVLLVDDDEDLRAALAEFLQDEGYQVSYCGSCREARELLEDAAYSCHMLLTDLKLPDGDGLEVVRTAKASQPDIVAAVMTGYASLETALKAIRVGAYDYVTKPFNFDEVEILLHNMSDKVRLVEENRRIHERLDALNRNLEDLSTIRMELSRLNRTLSEGLEALNDRLDRMAGEEEGTVVRKLPPYRQGH